MKRSLTAIFLLVGGIALAHGHGAEFSVDEIQSAAKLGVADFQVVEKQHADHFVGYKVWKSGEEAKLKIYVNHSGHNMEFNYLCHKHDAKIECHAQ